MVEQIPLLTLDKKQTLRNVEEKLETARFYQLYGYVRKETKVTPGYTPRFHGNTNAISKPVEDVGLQNVDTEEYMKQTLEAVNKAITRLSRREREVIQKLYLDQEDEFDYIVCREIGMSDKTFQRVKTKAIYKLAFMLRLEVWTEE